MKVADCCAMCKKSRLFRSGFPTGCPGALTYDEHNEVLPCYQKEDEK